MQGREPQVMCNILIRRAKDYEAEGYEPYWTHPDGTVAPCPEQADQAAACPIQPASHTASGNALPAASPDSAAAADETAASPDDTSGMHLQVDAMVEASAAAAVDGSSAEHMMMEAAALAKENVAPDLQRPHGNSNAVRSKCRAATHDALDLAVADQKPAPCQSIDAPSGQAADVTKAGKGSQQVSNQHMPNSRPSATGHRQTSRKRSISCVMGPPLALQPAVSEPADCMAAPRDGRHGKKSKSAPADADDEPQHAPQRPGSASKSRGAPKPAGRERLKREGKIRDAEVDKESAPSGKQGKQRAAKTAAEVGIWQALHCWRCIL